MEVLGFDDTFAIFMLAFNIIFTMFGIVLYVLRAMGLYTIAKRRGIHKPWTAWVPIADNWLLGSISDHYHWVTKGESRSKRKVLLTLTLVFAVLFLIIMILFATTFVSVIVAAIDGVEPDMGTTLLPMLGIAGLYFPLFGVAIAMSVFQYICLYDLYASASPSDKVLFLVLSIIFQITIPFFVFSMRHKDAGMLPPQYPPYYQPPYPPQYPDPGQYPYPGQPPYPQQ